jgi:hypothetical protein
LRIAAVEVARAAAAETADDVVYICDADPELLADAVVQVCRSEPSASLGERARSFALRLRLRDCIERERLCFREVIEIVRAGKRVPAGIHERMQPAELGD